MTLAQFAQTR